MEQNGFEIEGVTLAHCDSDDPVIVVPQGVEVIGENAFIGNDTMQKLVIPEGVREIQEWAISNCKALRTVSLPASLETIGTNAFGICEQLTDVTFPARDSASGQGEPAKLVSIGQYAFYRCVNLRKLDFPDSLTTISIDAFKDCGLTEFRLPRGIAALDSNVLPKGIQTLILHENVTFIRMSALLLLPCLNRVRFPAQTTSLPPDVLDSLPSDLSVLEAPGIPLLSLPSYLHLAAFLGLAEWEFRGNRAPEACEADAVSYASDRYSEFRKAAMDNPALLSFLLRRKLVPWQHAEVMLDQAQARESTDVVAMLLEYLRQFQTPEVQEQRRNEKMRELETGFLSAPAFDALWEYEENPRQDLVLTRYLGTATEVFLPAGREDRRVVKLAQELFTGNASVTSVQIPEGIQELDRRAFQGCSSLRTVSLPSTLTLIPIAAFADCPSLENVYIASGCSEIRDQAFSNCTALTELQIPEGVETIGTRAFSDCRQLRSVTLPSTLKVIQPYTFENCVALEKVTIAPGCRSIRKDAFLGCTALTELTIPVSVEDIQSGSFSGCDSLREVYLYGVGPLSVEMLRGESD